MKTFLFRVSTFVKRWSPIFLTLLLIVCVALGVCLYMRWGGIMPPADASGTTCNCQCSRDHASWWIGLVTMASALFTAASLISFAQLHESRTMNGFQRSYAKPKMARALRDLVDYRAEHADFFRLHRAVSMNQDARLVLSGVMAPNHWDEKVTDARRQIKFFFHNALSLYVSGAVSYATFRRIVDKSAICVLFDIVEPIESMLNPFYNHTAYYQLMLLCSDIYAKHKEHDYISGGRRGDAPSGGSQQTP